MISDNVKDLRDLAERADSDVHRLIASTAADALEALDARLRTVEDATLPRDVDSEVGLP